MRLSMPPKRDQESGLDLTIFDSATTALLQVLLEKLSYPALVIGTHLAVGKLLVEPKFSEWIVDQRLLQRLGLGKWDHRIGGRMSDENGQGSVADIFCR